MNALPLLNHTVSSLEVAEMIEKEHKYLMRDIRRYSKTMDGAKISPSDFWMESTYTNSQNKQQPCYQITKKGCEFIAHKTTGTKGTIFTARYINRFWEMEEELKKNSLSAEPQFMELPECDEYGFIPIPEYYLPLKESNWCSEHETDVQFVMFRMKIPKKTVYHMILTHLGKKYELSDVRKAYKLQYGYLPKYAMDIVDFLPQLADDATKYLEKLKNEFC